jgi:hypothetical protein
MLWHPSTVRNTLDIDMPFHRQLIIQKDGFLLYRISQKRQQKSLFGEEDHLKAIICMYIRINDEFTIDIMPSVAGIPLKN